MCPTFYYNKTSLGKLTKSSPTGKAFLVMDSLESLETLFKLKPKDIINIGVEESISVEAFKEQHMKGNKIYTDPIVYTMKNCHDALFGEFRS